MCGGCSCKGIKLAVAGALLVINDQGWVWNPISAWLLVGVILIVLGVMKAVWRCCPVHGCGESKPAGKPVKGK